METKVICSSCVNSNNKISLCENTDEEGVFYTIVHEIFGKKYSTTTRKTFPNTEIFNKFKETFGDEHKDILDKMKMTMDSEIKEYFLNYTRNARQLKLDSCCEHSEVIYKVVTTINETINIENEKKNYVKFYHLLKVLFGNRLDDNRHSLKYKPDYRGVTDDMKKRFIEIDYTNGKLRLYNDISYSINLDIDNGLRNECGDGYKEYDLNMDIVEVVDMVIDIYNLMVRIDKMEK